MPARPSHFKANLILFAVAAIWGSAFVAQSVAGRAGLSLLYNGVCFCLGGIVLLPLAWKRGLSSGQLKWMLAAGVLVFGGAALQQLGLRYTKVANASFLTTLYVIFTPFLLWVGYREKPRGVHLLAAALATLGAFLLSTSGTLTLQWGDVLETAGARVWGMHLVLIGKYAQKFDSLSFASGQFLVCGALSLAAGAAFEPFAALRDSAVLGAVAYRSLLSIAVGYTAQVWAQKFTSPTEASLIFALESVFAAVVAALLLEERLGAVQIAGCVAILAAASLSVVPAPVKPAI
jgi:drug/metabolite transporter (DMT)-like permease